MADSLKIPSGKHTKNYGKSQFLMGKSTISMAIFNSYVWHNQRVTQKKIPPCFQKSPLGLLSSMASFAFLLDSPGLVGAAGGSPCVAEKCSNGYGSMPINTIFRGMNIHKSQLFWCELQGYRVLTHPHIIGWPFKISGFIYGSGWRGHGWPWLGRGPHNTTPLPRRESLGAYPRYPQWRCSRWSTQRSSQFDPAQLSLPSQPLRHRCFLDGTLW